MLPKIVIGTINVKTAMGNTISVFVPFLITKEIDSTHMKKTMKILAQTTLQPIREVFCCKLHILKFQTSVRKKKPKLCLIRYGSQRSFISDELRNYLKLSVLPKESVFIKTFGKCEPTIKTVDIVQVKVLNPSKSVVVEAICKPFICSDILCQNIHSVSSQYDHSQNLTLADSSPDGNKRIDILAGVDSYYSCIGSEIKRGSGSQPLAISSIFG